MSSNGQEKETTFYDPNVLNEAFSSCAYNIFAHCDHVVDTSEYFNSTALIFVLFEFLANTWTWYLNRAAIDIFQMTTLIWNHLNTSFHWHVFFWHSKRWNCILALPKEKKNTVQKQRFKKRSLRGIFFCPKLHHPKRNSKLKHFLMLFGDDDDDSSSTMSRMKLESKVENGQHDSIL